MSVKKDSHKAKRSVIKAQEELLANSVQELREALGLLNNLMRFKIRKDQLLVSRTNNNDLQQDHRSRGNEENKALEAMRVMRVTRATKEKMNTDICSRGITLH